MPTFDSDTLNINTYCGSTYYYCGFKLTEEEWLEHTNLSWAEPIPFTTSVQLTQSQNVGNILKIDIVDIDETEYPDVEERWYNQMYKDVTAQKEQYKYNTSRFPEVVADTTMINGKKEPLKQVSTYVRLADIREDGRLKVQPINSTATVELDSPSLVNIYHCSDKLIAEYYGMEKQIISHMI